MRLVLPSYRSLCCQGTHLDASVAVAAWRSQLQAHQHSDTGTTSSWLLVKEALSADLLVELSGLICIHHKGGWQTEPVSRVPIGLDSRMPFGSDSKGPLG